MFLSMPPFIKVSHSVCTCVIDFSRGIIIDVAREITGSRIDIYAFIGYWLDKYLTEFTKLSCRAATVKQRDDPSRTKLSRLFFNVRPQLYSDSVTRIFLWQKEPFPYISNQSRDIEFATGRNRIKSSSTKSHSLGNSSSEIFPAIKLIEAKRARYFWLIGETTTVSSSIYY